MRMILALGALSLLGACQISPARSEARVQPGPAPSVAPVPGQPGDAPPVVPVPPAGIDESCDVSGLQYLVGQPVPDPFPVTGHVRILPQGLSVTMEYEPGRITVWLGPDGRIESIACG